MNINSLHTFLFSLAIGGLASLFMYYSLKKRKFTFIPHNEDKSYITSSEENLNEISHAHSQDGKVWGINKQYQNTHVDFPYRHPVLQYQMETSMGLQPATPGDPLRPPDISGPVGQNIEYIQSMLRPNAPVGMYSNHSDKQAYYENQGPYPGNFNGIQVPLGSLRETNERYNKDQFKLPNSNLPPPGIYRGPEMITPNQGDFFRPFGPNAPINKPFFGNVNAYSPFPEIVTPWEKAGILTSSNIAGTTGISTNGSNILNLYRRPIAPVQSLWEYQVEDNNGFIIKLGEKYIEDGDIIRHIIGKEGLGPWKANIFVQNKYVWV